MNAEIFIILLKIITWLVFIFISAFFEMADSALRGLKVREIVESDHGKRKTVNLWLKYGTHIRLAIAVWKSIFFACAIISTVIIYLDINYNLNLVIRIVLIALMTLITVLIGNMLPRMLAGKMSDKSTFRIVKIANFWTAGTHYFNFFIARIANLIAGIMGVKNGMNVFENQIDDSALSEIADKDDSLEKDEHEMIKSIFEFGDTVVREVMVPRTEMEAVPVSCMITEAIEIALEAGHSRLPVYENNIDSIIGVFYLRDAMKFWKNRADDELPELRKVMRKPFCVPETKKVNELLKELKAAKIQLAIIIDEYGGTAGLATLEDLVEEIVGEIQDEFDADEEEEYEQIDDKTFIIDAGVLVDDVNDDLGVNLPEEEDFDTIGGYVMFELGHMPREGEIISHKEFVIKIIKVTDRRVEKVELKCLNPNSKTKEDK